MWLPTKRRLRGTRGVSDQDRAAAWPPGASSARRWGQPSGQLGASVAPLRHSIEELPCGVEHVGAAVVAGVGVVDDPVVEGESAEPVKLRAAQVHVGMACCAEVEAGACAPLILGEEGEVEVEVGSERRDPWEAPAAATLVGVQLVERCRDTATNVTSWCARWRTAPSRLSAVYEQPMQGTPSSVRT